MYVAAVTLLAQNVTWVNLDLYEWKHIHKAHEQYADQTTLGIEFLKKSLLHVILLDKNYKVQTSDDYWLRREVKLPK